MQRTTNGGFKTMNSHPTDQPKETVGIASLGYYIPSGILTSSEISQRSGVPLHVFSEYLGMEQKHIAAADEHPSEMGIKAADKAIKKAGIKAEDIAIVAYCGTGPCDYRFWSPAARISAALGINNSYAFEVRNGCNGGNLGLNICKNLLLDDTDREYALVICSEKLSGSCICSTENRYSRLNLHT
jgi:3-oxoacyl-[acyl-carrier-protein] synthase III